MKITETHISIPPYISTTWDNISSLHSEEGLLIFSLKDGNDIEVPNLTKQEIDEIFSQHLHFLEHEDRAGPGGQPLAQVQKRPAQFRELPGDGQAAGRRRGRQWHYHISRSD